jgi:acetyl-CoA carboxylase biotin carboxylase subunit
VGGIRTNIPLFRLILNDPAFRRGDLHTGYLDELLKTPLEWDKPLPSELAGIVSMIATQKKAGETACPGNSRWVAAGREDLLR